jgi:hypothetical protein
MNSDNAWNESGGDGENYSSGQGNEAMGHKQYA